MRLPLRKKRLARRARACLAAVDLALAQPLEQVVGRQVDQLDLVGALEERVGHGLPDTHAGDLGDDVVEALECWTLSVV